MNNGAKWTEKEETSLIGQLRLGKKPNKINIRNRSNRAINHKISQLRSQDKLDIHFLTPWSEKEDENLLGQVENKNLNDIRIPNRSVSAIYARIKSLRELGHSITLVKRLRPQQIKARDRKKEVEKRKKDRKRKLVELKKLLKGEGRYWPSAVVAEKLSCNPDLIGRWRKRWGLQIVHKEAMNDPIYKERYARGTAKRLEWPKAINIKLFTIVQ